MSRRPIVALAVFLLVVAGADYAAWRVATDRLMDAYLDWQASLAPSGWSIVSDPPMRAGWPLAATLRLDRMRLGQAAGGFAWSADHVALVVSLLHPHRLSVRPAGNQVFGTPGSADIHLQAAGLDATAPLGTPIRAAHLTGRDVTVTTPQGDAVAQTLDLDLTWADDAAQLSLALGPITLPPGHRWGLGNSTTMAALDLVAHGAWPAGPPMTAAAQWRDAGGSVDISRLAVQWGTLNVSASGRATLDADLQPDASLSLHVADPQAAVSTLADVGVIGAGPATAVNAVLALLSMPDRLAGRPVVLDLPARISQGTMTIGAIPVARVPRWGGVGEARQGALPLDPAGETPQTP